MGTSTARLATLSNAFHFLLSLLLLLALLLPSVFGQPTDGAADGGTIPTTEEEIASKLAPYAPAIGGVIAGLGVILGRWLGGLLVGWGCGSSVV